MTDAAIAVSFTAEVGDLVAGVGEARDALMSLAPSFVELNGQSAALKASMAEAFSPARLQPYNDALTTTEAVERSLAAAQAEAAQAIKAADADASADAARAARVAVSAEIQAIADGARQKLALYAEEARQHEITIQQKLALSRQALAEELADQVGALRQEAALGEQTLAQKTRVDEQILAAERRNRVCGRDRNRKHEPSRVFRLNPANRGANRPSGRDSIVD